MTNTETRRPVPPGARGYERFPGTVGRTFTESTSAWDAAPTAPVGAPNIIVVVVDDLGYADIGPYGSEIDTPHLDALADSGVALTNYHTAPVCSPARAALLTGINPHRAGFAHVAGFDPGFPNYTLELADDVQTLPEVLRGRGYATYAVGKWHLSREDLLADSADRRSWPLQRGFDRYYGCLEGFTSFFHPNRLVRDNSPLAIDEFPEDYYLTDDLTDEAVAMIHGLRAHDADKPFFMYFAHHAVHAPLAARRTDIDKYAGRYDLGWDNLREERFARQVELGLFPAETSFPARNHEMARYTVPDWAEVDPDDRARYARHMEVYAAMVDSIDQSLGRLLAVVAEYGELDNTIVVFTSDNGASAEGGAEGTRSYLGQFIHHLKLPGDWPRDTELPIDRIGGPRAMSHYPRGWAAASNTPFRLYKGTTFAGGVRTPFLISWPRRLREQAGTRRGQFQFVTDVFPTLLELAGLDAPRERAGVEAREIDGLAFGSVLREPGAADVRTEQYAELGGNRGLYADGWKILTLHEPGPHFEDTEWQLFDLATDPTETTDVGEEHPERLAAMAARWEELAWHNTVFPLNDASGILQHRTRPDRSRWSMPVRLRPGTPTLERIRSAELVRLRSVEIDIAFGYSADNTNVDAGVLVSHGDQNGGYVVFVEDGQIRVGYNEYGTEHLIPGLHLKPGHWRATLRLAARPAFRWQAEIAVAAPGQPERISSLDTEVFMMLGLTPFTGISVGIDRGGPVLWGLHERHGAFAYCGQIDYVEYRPGAPAAYDPARLQRAEKAVADIYD